jgi:high-affinity Fe2+/Pb2+ permease
MSLLENKNDEYVGKPSKIKAIFGLIFLIAICAGFVSLVFYWLIPYSWNEFIDYENGKEIKNNWAIWALYDLGGKKLVCGMWALFGGFFVFCALVFVKQIFTTLFNKEKK